MPKRLTNFKALTEFVKQNPCFEIIDNVLFCNSCNEIKVYNPNEGVRLLRKHISSKKHQVSVELSSSQQRLHLEAIDAKKTKSFHLDLTEALISQIFQFSSKKITNLKGFLKNILEKR